MIIQALPYKIDYDFLPNGLILYNDYPTLYPMEVEDPFNITERPIRYIDASNTIENKALHEYAFLAHEFFEHEVDNLYSVFLLPINVDLSSYSAISFDRETNASTRTFRSENIEYTVTEERLNGVSNIKITANTTGARAAFTVIADIDYFITKDIYVDFHSSEGTK